MCLREAPLQNKVKSGAKALNGTLGTGSRVPNERSQVLDTEPLSLELLGTKFGVPWYRVPNEGSQGGGTLRDPISVPKVDKSF